MDYFKNSLDYATATATTTQKSFLLQPIPELREIHHYKEGRGNWRLHGMTKRFCTLKLLHFTSSFYCHAYLEPSSSFVFSDSFIFLFMTLIHITTHFSDHPVLSFSMIRLSTTHHSVQPNTMQFVYATSDLMPHLSLE